MNDMHPIPRALTAAIATLQRLGYTYHGGEQWKPPLGQRPAWLDESPVMRALMMPQFRETDAEKLGRLQGHELSEALSRIKLPLPEVKNDGATVTTKKRRNGTHAVMFNGATVGDIWRRPGKGEFALRLAGIYWQRNGKHTRIGGCSTTSFPRMLDAVAKAESVLMEKRA